MANERKVPFIITADDQASKKFDLLKSKLGSMDGAFSKLSGSLLGKFSPQMQGALSGLGNSLGNLKSKLSNVPVFQGAAIAGGIAMATNSLIDNAVATTDQLGRLNDLNQMYGISTDTLQAYSVVAKASGTDLEAVAKSYGKMKENLLAAQQGDKAKILEFRAVGITQEDLKKPSEEVMAKIATVFKESTKDMDDELKSTFAKQIFGKAGADIIPFLNEGGQKFKETIDLLRKQNRLFSNEQIKQADEVGDNWSDSVARIDSIKQKIGIAMLPMLSKMTESINKMLDSGGGDKLIATFSKIGDSIALNLPKIIDAIPKIADGFGKLFTTIGGVADFIGWDKLILGGVALFAAPFVASMLDIGGAVFSVIKRLVLLASTTSIGGSIITAVNAGLSLSFIAVGTAVKALWLAITSPIALVVGAIALVGYGVYQLWKHWDTVKEVLVGVWESIKQFGAAAWEVIKNVGKVVVDFLLMPLNNVIEVINLAIKGINKVSGSKIELIQRIEPFKNEAVGAGVVEPMKTISETQVLNTVATVQNQRIESKVGGELKISIDNPAARVENISTTPNFGLKINTGAVL